MGVTAKPKTSRQNQKPHGKTKNLTTKPNSSRQNQKLHGKTKTSRQNQKPSRQNQKPHGKNQKPHCKTKNLHGKSKNLTTKPNRVHGGSDFFVPSPYLFVGNECGRLLSHPTKGGLLRGCLCFFSRFKRNSYRPANPQE